MTKDEAIAWAGGVTALAEKLGITPSAVSHWENNEVPRDQQVWIWMRSGCTLQIDPKYMTLEKK